MATEFVRIFPGAENVRMDADSWPRYCEIVRGDEAPGEGWYLVVKGKKPDLQPGQMLQWTFDVENAVAYKRYSAWSEPRAISKRKLMNGLKGLGIWDAVKSYMEQSGVWDDFAMATTLDDNDPLVTQAISQLVAAGVTTEETLKGVIDASLAL